MLKSGDDLDGDFSGVLDLDDTPSAVKKKVKKKRKQLLD